jgi:hypothetical protein
MKRTLTLAIYLGVLGAPTASIGQEIAIVGPLSDGTVASIPRAIDSREFEVRETVVHDLADRKITIHRVRSPGPQAPPEETPQPAPAAPMAGGEAHNKPLHALLLAATVVDNQATFLRWWRAGQEYQAWSNVNFNYLTGFSRFRVGEKPFSPVIALANVNSATSVDPNLQSIPPDLPPGPPAFVVTQGDSTNAASTEVVVALHELYRAESARLQQAYQSRQQSLQQREAEQAANPPLKDIVLRYWKVQPKKKGLTR